MYLDFTYHYLKGGFIKYQTDGNFELGFDENEEPYISDNDGKVEKRVSRSVKRCGGFYIGGVNNEVINYN